MLAFLTSIRHPDTASNLGELEQLFELTARSVCGQTSQDFRLVVVCHEKPRIGFTHEKIYYHLVDWPAPIPLRTQKYPFSHKSIDKGSKLALAALIARDLGADWCFPVDADDWISRSVVAYVHEHHSPHGYVVDKGHFVNWRRMEYKRRRDLTNYCGSTYCPATDDLLQLIPRLAQSRSLPEWDRLRESVPLDFLEDGFGDHKIPVYLAKQGKKMRRFPFFATAWVMNNGENIFGSADGEHGRPIDEPFCLNYALPPSLVQPRTSTLVVRVGETMSYGRSCLESWRKRD